jgi:hypothetical protein
MWLWLKRWSGFLLFAVGGLLMWVLLQKRGASPHVIKSELKAIKAEARAAKAQEEKGLHVALAEVQKEYLGALRALDETEKMQANELRQDPQALAGFLVRAAGRRERTG